MEPEDFRAWRKKYRMMQTHVGNLLGGITKRTIVNWEQGRPIDPTAITAVRWFEILPEEIRLQLVENAHPSRD